MKEIEIVLEEKKRQLDRIEHIEKNFTRLLEATSIISICLCLILRFYGLVFVIAFIFLLFGAIVTEIMQRKREAINDFYSEKYYDLWQKSTYLKELKYLQYTDENENSWN